MCLGKQITFVLLLHKLLTAKITHNHSLRCSLVFLEFILFIIFQLPARVEKICSPVPEFVCDSLLRAVDQWLEWVVQ